jgi:alpha-1,2-mannosyltransferase
MARSKNIRVRTSPLAVLTAVALLFLLIAGGFYFARRSGTDLHRYQNDFNVYYLASHEVIEGRDPYQNSLGEWTPYLYLPLLAELIIPLALMPLQAAAYFWFLLGAASLIVAAWISAALALKDANNSGSQRFMVSALAVVVVIRFALDNFDYGQVNTLVAVLSVAHVFLYEKNRKLSSALALALAASIKLTPLILLVYHVAKRRTKFVAGCILLFISITALSFAPFGSRAPSAFQTFFHRTVKNEQGFDLAYSGNQSLRGAVARLRGDDEESARIPGDPITLAISLAMLAGSALTAMRKPESFSSLVSLFCCIPLLSPLAWKGHFVALLFPAALLISDVASRPRTKLSYGFIAVLIAAFALFNLSSPRIIGLAASEWVDRHSLICAGALLIYLATICSSTPSVRSEPGSRQQGGGSHELHE